MGRNLTLRYGLSVREFRVEVQSISCSPIHDCIGFPRHVVMFLSVFFTSLFSSALFAEYAETIKSDEPVAYWRFDDGLTSEVGEFAAANRKAKLKQPGPRPERYPDFDKENMGVMLAGLSTFITIKDPGDKSVFDFHNGDTITLEAWVNPNGLPEGQQVYVIGKGRTGNNGFRPNNQNWALRLRGEKGLCVISFLFRNGKNSLVQEHWHRWNSSTGFAAMTGWHHVAVSYTFGAPESIHGYVDGKEVQGTWDYGGSTKEAPVVDNDEVWIGSSLGGGHSSTFDGSIDEIAVYRKALSPERIKARCNIDPSAKLPTDSEIAREDIPEGKVLVQVLEKVPGRNWSFVRPNPSETFTQDVLAFSVLPQKYSNQAIRIDRSDSFLVRAATIVKLEAGEYRLLMRSLSGAKLYLDGRPLITNRFIPGAGDAHGKVPPLPEALVTGMREVAIGHASTVASFKSTGGEHLVMTELFVGGDNNRPEVGEFSVSLARGEEMFRVLSPKPEQTFPLTDQGWDQFAARNLKWVENFNTARREEAGQEERRYWDDRHETARRLASENQAPTPPEVPESTSVRNVIDRFIGKRLVEENVGPAALSDDYTFLRRLYLDVLGVVPAEEEVAKFFKLTTGTRRAQAIEQCLQSGRWADNWVGYWQDVLAENPGILKPMLNNTGPFRWFIHESFSDNKPFDRFVTELIEMNGSKYYGGPAGFAMATQNDLPMAAKAHIIGQAFLAVQMKCARCHDAPYHDVTQKDLFSTAAMLQRKAVNVPKTSTIQRTPEEIEQMIVKITLKAGEEVGPTWAFDKFVKEIPADFVRNTGDARQRLAALITSPGNKRFAQVIANRMWKRYLGWGIVEPVDDWEKAKPSHPELLDFLAYELITNGYDLKHLARLILNSDTYQRAIDPAKAEPVSNKLHLFASPVRKRMRAEQILDSLFVISGKPYNSEMLTLDVDRRQPVTTFLNLGVPTRAWEFASLSNERDRPSLAMPYAQSINDFLKTFGWRESRQDPVSDREEYPTVQQPAMLANGTVSRRVTGLSDESSFTRISLGVQSPEELVDRIFMRILTRKPDSGERQTIVEFLKPGFEIRIVKAGNKTTRARKVHAVSWSNHLSKEANEIKLEIEKTAREGDPPTEMLDADWRVRMEDVVWALVNSPEFVFVP